MPITARELIEGRPTPTTVKLHDLVHEALALMFENDFTTLPVVDGEHRLIGVITTNSILRTIKFLNPQLNTLKVADVIGKTNKFSHDTEIPELLEALNNQPSVIIVDNEDRVAGIITSWDTSEYFRKHAEDLMTVEDIENSLIDHITAAFTDVQSGQLQHEKLALAITEVSSAYTSTIVKKAVKTYLLCLSNEIKIDSGAMEQTVISFRSKPDEIKSLDELTLNELISLLFHNSVWKDYQSTFTIEKTRLQEMLDQVRHIRNVLAHFKSEITRDERDLLRFCTDWLQNKNPPRALVTLPLAESPATDYDMTALGEDISPEESRYALLALYLQNQPMQIDRLRLTFDEVEKIIENELPASARKHRSWWANDTVSHVQSQQWLEADWRVGVINMTEGAVTFVRAKEREKLYIDFFSTLLDGFRAKATFPIRDVFPIGVNWHTVGGFKTDRGIQVAGLSFSFARGRRFRVELYIDSGDQLVNKRNFDILYAQKEIIESRLGEVGWERLDDRRASRIAIYTHGSIMDSPEELDAVRAWAIDGMQAMYDVLSPIMKTNGYSFRG